MKQVVDQPGPERHRGRCRRGVVTVESGLVDGRAVLVARARPGPAEGLDIFQLFVATKARARPRPEHRAADRARARRRDRRRSEPGKGATFTVEPARRAAGRGRGRRSMSVKGRTSSSTTRSNAAAALETLPQGGRLRRRRAHDARRGCSCSRRTSPTSSSPTCACRAWTDRAAGQDQGDPARDHGHRHDRLRHREDRGQGHEARGRGLPGASRSTSRSWRSSSRRRSSGRTSLAEARSLRERLEHEYRLDNLVGESPEMLSVFKTIRQVAPRRRRCLLLGESGTGKELFAQALHQNSRGATSPSSRSTARRCRRRSSRASSSATRRARSPGRRLHARGPLRARRRGHPLPRRDRRHHARPCR